MLDTPEFRKHIELLYRYHSDNVVVLLRDEINVRDIVELKTDEEYFVKFPVVSNEGVLLYERELEHHTTHPNPITGSTLYKTTKEPKYIEIGSNSVVFGLVVRKLYVKKTNKTPDYSLEEGEEGRYYIKPGMTYPVYDILTPEGIVRFDLEGETYVDAYNDLIFLDSIHIRKVRSLPNS